MTTKETLLKYVTFKSQVDPSFWQRLSELKLEKDKLNENVHQIWGYYSNRKPEGQNQLLSIDASSFNELPDQNRMFGVGSIINKNTIEGFKEENKLEILKNEGQQMLRLFNQEAIEKPSFLSRFLIFTFANLKNYLFYYWFAFPAPTFLSCNYLGPSQNIKDVLNINQINILQNSYNTILDCHNKGFFIVEIKNNNLELYTLKEGIFKINNNDNGNWLLGFSDSSDSGFPSWPLRNFIALITYHCPEFVKKKLQVLCLRLEFLERQWTINNSIILNIKVNIEKEISKENWVGWERNEKGKMGPRLANLKHFMNPLSLAETSVDLNLKLMKWQILPELDLKVIKQSRCLLIGAGTLGCVVARNLMSWGVRNIDFIDYGVVSHSNPVRQFLYTFQDTGKPKAEAAAAALKQIFPGTISSGFSFTIPMPGHPVGESLINETKENVKKLEELIENHDAIFLLMDSRESRWLPTLIASSKGKLVINAALGFDSYLVMRHGQKCSLTENESENCKEPILSGDKLGCYFCNDVTAPGNSLKGRTLDQQCTVTRPGVSSLAGALAVELFISILQHPLRGLAPAEKDPESVQSESLLGIVPHSIRAFLSQYQTVLPAIETFSSCVACSDKVINKYREEGFNFILHSLESKEYLEDICGLTALQNESLLSDIMEYSDSDPEE